MPPREAPREEPASPRGPPGRRGGRPGHRDAASRRGLAPGSPAAAKSGGVADAHRPQRLRGPAPRPGPARGRGAAGGGQCRLGARAPGARPLSGAAPPGAGAIAAPVAPRPPPAGAAAAGLPAALRAGAGRTDDGRGARHHPREYPPPAAAGLSGATRGARPLRAWLGAGASPPRRSGADLAAPHRAPRARRGPTMRWRRGRARPPRHAHRRADG